MRAVARLANQVERRIEQAARFPQSGALVLGFDEEIVEEIVVRQSVIGGKLPFVVITALIDDERVAIAVAHTRREPSYWKSIVVVALVIRFAVDGVDGRSKTKREHHDRAAICPVVMHRILTRPE